MRIHTATHDGGEIKQLEAHSQHDPGDGDTGPHGPAPPGLGVLAPAVQAPQQIRHEPADDVSCHVVRVVPPPQLEVGNMREIHPSAQQRPGAQHGAAAGRGTVEAEVVHGGVVQAVEDVEPGAEVVELFGEGEVTHVEYAAGRPAGDADVGDHDIKGPQGVRSRDGGADFVQAVDVRPEVGGGEEDGEGLLHAENARKGPFAVELDDGLAGSDALGGDDALAGVVALGGAVPEKEAAVQGCGFPGEQSLLALVCWGQKGEAAHGWVSAALLGRSFLACTPAHEYDQPLPCFRGCRRSASEGSRAHWCIATNLDAFLELG